jgi:hypothetical protein
MPTSEFCKCTCHVFSMARAGTAQGESKSAPFVRRTSSRTWRRGGCPPTSTPTCGSPQPPPPPPLVGADAERRHPGVVPVLSSYPATLQRTPAALTPLLASSAQRRHYLDAVLCTHPAAVQPMANSFTSAKSVRSSKPSWATRAGGGALNAGGGVGGGAPMMDPLAAPSQTGRVSRSAAEQPTPRKPAARRPAAVTDAP